MELKLSKKKNKTHILNEMPQDLNFFFPIIAFSLQSEVDSNWNKF